MLPESIHNKFTSSNSINVPQATITREEYLAILDMEKELALLKEGYKSCNTPIDPSAGDCINSYPESSETTLPGFSPKDVNLSINGATIDGYHTEGPFTIKRKIPPAAIIYYPDVGYVEQEGHPPIQANFGLGLDNTSVALVKLVNNNLTITECYDIVKRKDESALIEKGHLLLDKLENQIQKLKGGDWDA